MLLFPAGVQELREHVKDVGFRGLYWQAMSNAVMGVSWLKADKIEQADRLIFCNTAGQFFSLRRREVEVRQVDSRGNVCL
jgi:hypothetical protein